MSGDPSQPGLAARGVPTIVDVARAAGVSVRTVSRVINDSPKVGAATRVTVQRVVAALGFTPSARAQAFATGKSRLIGVIQGDENAHVLGGVQQGIVLACTPSGHELVVHPTALTGRALVANLETFVRRSRVDGLIILSPTSEDAELGASARRLSVPTVALASTPVAGYDAVLASCDRDGGAQAATHLAELGHRRVAIVTGPARRLSSTERREGFRDRLNALGVQVPDDLVVEGDYGFASGLEAARRLFALPERPTAIFACNDLMAAGAMKAARQAGLDVPGAVSVIGFDDTDLSTMLAPALTTVRRSMGDVAARAADVLIGLIGGVAAAPVQDFAVRLIARETTGPPA